MTDQERKSLLTLISEREEIAYKRLNGNMRYLEICQRQKKTEETVEEFIISVFQTKSAKQFVVITKVKLKRITTKSTKFTFKALRIALDLLYILDCY